jgi:hypothetical protein
MSDSGKTCPDCGYTVGHGISCSRDLKRAPSGKQAALTLMVSADGNEYEWKQQPGVNLRPFTLAAATVQLLSMAASNLIPPEKRG